MEALTEKQSEILQVIRMGIENRGYAPTIRDIGAMVHLSSSCSVKKHLDSLEVKGYIRRDRYRRDIELCDNGEPVTFARTVCVPLIGRVAGGNLRYAEDSAEPELLPLPLSLLPRGAETSKDLFALEVYGDSMRDAGISDGDIVVARRQSTAHNGEIVIARVDDEATVKRYFREKDHIRLQPENPDFEPICVRDVAIMGAVTLAVKRF